MVIVWLVEPAEWTQSMALSFISYVAWESYLISVFLWLLICKVGESNKIYSFSYEIYEKHLEQYEANKGG